MKVKFWGVRGSIPSPGSKTVRYGGNTTCIEVRTDDGHLIILDGGTGIFPLAESLLAEQPVSARIFNTHSHWDHIQGLPFFLPLFSSGNHIRLYATNGLGLEDGPERILRAQLQYSYFPINEVKFKSPIHYRTVTPDKAIAVGSATVTPISLNHPGGDVGYLISDNGKSVFFTGDHEPYPNLAGADDAGVAPYDPVTNPQNYALAQALKGIDLLIVDSTYTHDEYQTKQGWGHGTFDSSIRLAKTAEVGALYCTHHEPSRSDDELELALSEALTRHANTIGNLTVHLAREGEEIVL